MQEKLSKITSIINVISFLTMIFLGIELFRTINEPQGEIKHLDYKNALVLHIDVDKWYYDKQIIMEDKKSIDELLSYINSLELVEVPKNYEGRSGHSYRLWLPYHDVTITGEYITVHKSSDDDKVFEEYYIKNSGYNFVTGSSKVSMFIDSVIK